MLALRLAAVLGLVFWVGGLAVLGSIAAPALFEVVGASGTGGRALAGAAFGEIFARFHTATYVCAAVIIASLATRAVLGPRPRHFSIRMFISTVMVAASAWSGLVLIPRIQDAQRTLGSSPSALPAGDARRAEFDRLHGMSTSLQLVPLLGGLALIFFELKD
jgi:hypothetical protein